MMLFFNRKRRSTTRSSSVVSAKNNDDDEQLLFPTTDMDESGILQTHDDSVVDVVRKPPSPSASSFSKRRKSCMVVRTQEESLQRIDTDSTKQERGGGEDCAAATEQASPEKSRKLKMLTVQFTDVKFHFHYMTLGDNPSVSCGLPLTIEWDRFHASVLAVDEYEKTKIFVRFAKELLVPKRIRTEWIRNAGIKQAEIVQVQREIRCIQSRSSLCLLQSGCSSSATSSWFTFFR